MTRALLIIAAVAVWLICFGVAMVTIIPLSAMGFAAIFDGSFTTIERLEGLGFALVGVIVVATSCVALTGMVRFLGRRSPVAD